MRFFVLAAAGAALLSAPAQAQADPPQSGQDQQSSDFDGDAVAKALLGRVRELRLEREAALAEGNYPEAIAANAEILVMIGEVSGESSEEFNAMLEQHGKLQFDGGDYGGAAASLAKLLVYTEAKYGPTSRQAILGRGNIALQRLLNGEAALAETITAEQLELARSTLGASDRVTLVATNIRASALKELGRLAEAEALLEAGLADGRRALPADDPDLLILLNSYAGILIVERRIAEADPVTEEALRLTSAKQGARHPDTLISATNRGALLAGQGRWQEARDLLAANLDIAIEVLGVGHPDTATLANNLAVAMGELGEPEAEEMMSQVINARLDALGNRHPLTLASVLNYGWAQYQKGAFADAVKLFATADTLAQAALANSDETATMIASNHAYGMLSLPDQAAKAIEPARRAAAGVRTRLASTGNSPREEAQQTRVERAGSQTFLTLADAAWVARQSAPASDADGKALLGEAFTALQDAGASSVNAAIRQQAARALAGAAGTKAAALARERQELSEAWKRIGEAASVAQAGKGEAAAKGRDELLARQAAAEQRIAAIDAELAKTAPEYFALVQPAALSPEQASALLGADEAVLMIVPTDHGTHVMAITGGGVAWYRSDWEANKIALATRRLLWFAGADVKPSPAEVAEWSDAAPGENSFDRTSAFALWQQLVAPAAADLAGKRNLFVIAEGALSSLPFGVLVSAAPQGDDNDAQVLRDTHWLADDHALTQLPSLQSLAMLRRFAKRGGVTDFSGWGDPALSGAATERGGRGAAGTGRAMAAVYSTARTAMGGALADGAALRSMASLPGTGTELRAMAGAFSAGSGALHLGSAATEGAIRKADLSNAGILAFATHGLIAGEIGGAVEPGLVFTPPASPSADDDGLLTSSEVTTLKLNADWVILSACNTAAGDGTTGAQGLSGLARAFFYAGARNLLVSHWPVRDDVAAKLTVRTIEIARDNPALSRAAALAQAMKEIRNNTSADAGGGTWASPNAWAPFTLVGDGAR